MNFAAVPLRQTTGDDKLLTISLNLQFRHFKNRVNRLFLGCVDESTCIHDDDIGFFFLRGNGIALPGESPQHDFAVHQVLGTAEANKSYFRRFIRHSNDSSKKP